MHNVITELSTQENFVDSNELQELNSLVDHCIKNNLLFGRPQRPMRFYCQLDMHHNGTFMTPLIHLLIDRARSITGIHKSPIDSKLGIILSVIYPGGQVEYHLDKYDDKEWYSDDKSDDSGYTNRRLCVMLQRESHHSYDPVVHTPELIRVPLTVDPGTAWFFNASQHMHGTEVIVGNSPRVVLQIGFKCTTMK